MTEQYGQRNINDPAGATFSTGVVGTPVQMTASDVGKTVFFDTAAGNCVTTLPASADAGAGAEIVFVFPDGGAANTATVAVVASDTLVLPAGSPANPAVTANATKTVRADGLLSWFVVSGLA